MTCSGIPAPGIPTDWSDLTDYVKTLKAGYSCHSERWYVASMCGNIGIHYNLDFTHIGALRKEQKTYLVNLACGKMFLQSCRLASALCDNKVAITEQSQKEGVIYALQSRLTLPRDLFRRTSWS